MVLESDIETYFNKSVERNFPDAENRKFKSRRNDPDRLILFSGGLAKFVELKRPSGRRHRAGTARPGQLREHKRLRDLGFDVAVLSTRAEVDAWIYKQLEIS